MTVETAFKNIADAIRTRAGSSGALTPAQMPQAILDIPGGGVDLLTAAEWNALTTAQKQAYGLVAIEQASSGYQRGVLVNGADYEPLLALFQNGTAACPLIFAGRGGSIDASNQCIALYAAGGVFYSHVTFDQAIDMSAYTNIRVHCATGTGNFDATTDVDISSVTGQKYVQISYETNTSYNTMSVAFTDTTTATTSFFAELLPRMYAGASYARIFEVILS